MLLESWGEIIYKVKGHPEISDAELLMLTEMRLQSPKIQEPKHVFCNYFSLTCQLSLMVDHRDTPKNTKMKESHDHRWHLERQLACMTDSLCRLFLR